MSRSFASCFGYVPSDKLRGFVWSCSIPGRFICFAPLLCHSPESFSQRLQKSYPVENASVLGGPLEIRQIRELKASSPPLPSPAVPAAPIPCALLGGAGVARAGRMLRASAAQRLQPSVNAWVPLGASPIISAIALGAALLWDLPADTCSACEKC